ncbi:MAG: transketolase [Alphaproteobacteria bacterium]|nr:transketolase [Alphaproteobacteria bacterium]
MRQASLTMVHELARQDKRVLFIGSDLGSGTLEPLRQEFPERFFMEGIAEANLIGMAAGLAMEGFIPYVNTIATFLTRRAFEQIALDVCLHHLPVRLIGSGGGLVYAPLGPTHQAIDELALMRSLPGMTVVAPSDASEMRAMMKASLDLPGPLYIRLGKGGDPVLMPEGAPDFVFGRAVVVRDLGPVLLISTGVMSDRALKAADLLAQKGIDCALLHLPTVKPLDEETIIQFAAKARLVVSIEEHSKIGGLGSALAELFIDRDLRLCPLLRLALPDAFVENYGSQDSLLKRFGLQPEGIADQVRKALESAPS